MAWLGNVPIDALIKLRKENILGDMRNILGHSIRQIETADENTYEEIVTDVIHNINERFFEHMAELRKLSGRTNSYLRYDVAPWLVVGGIQIAAASTQNIPLSMIGASLGMFQITSVKDVWRKGRELISDQSLLKRSPVGILFDAHNEKL